MHADSGTADVTVSGAHTCAPPPPPPPQNKPPHAEFDVQCAQLTCTFTDRSTDEDGTITSRSWDYGDGSPPSSVASRTDERRGGYPGTLPVTDNGGARKSQTHDAMS